MAREMSRVSTSNKLCRPLITRKKGATFASKSTTSTGNLKFWKRKGRRKITQTKCKWKRSANGDVTNSDSSVQSKKARKKNSISVADRKIASDVSCGLNSVTKNDGEMIRKNEPMCVSDDDTVHDTSERVQVSLPTSSPTTTTNDFPKSWTARMIRYYFEPNDNCKNFDYVKIMNKVEYKASDWWISDADRTECRKKREFFQRCAKCNQKGHTKKECKKLVVCHVCGEFNHRYPDCPNALCFTCGRATKKYSDSCRQCRKILNCRRTCTLCGQVWHEENLCPSKWRKYVAVTRSPASRGSTLRLNSKKCCYNCARSGHFGFECPIILQSDYPPENPLKTAFPLGQRFTGNGDDLDNHRGSNNGDTNGERDHKNSTHPFADAGGIACAELSRVHVIFLARQTSDLLFSEMGRLFLTNLSHNTNVRIELFRGKRSYLKVFGDDRVVNYCRTELVKWKTP